MKMNQNPLFEKYYSNLLGNQYGLTSGFLSSIRKDFDTINQYNSHLVREYSLLVSGLILPSFEFPIFVSKAGNYRHSNCSNQRELQEIIQEHHKKFNQTKSREDYVELIRLVNELKSILRQAYVKLKKKASKLRGALNRIVCDHFEIVYGFLVMRLCRQFPSSGKDEVIINGSFKVQFLTNPIIIISYNHEQTRQDIYSRNFK